jgi:iron-sulfur cluster repair protein YtfE (RIC family)
MAWALRVGLLRPRAARNIGAHDAEILARLAHEHRSTLGLVERVRDVADGLDDNGSVDAVRELLTALDTVLLPHERQEEKELVPALERITGGADAIGALSRSHAEIEHHVAALHRLVGEEQVDAEAITDLRRTLYGLYGVLRLHNAMEEESAFALLE